MEILRMKSTKNTSAKQPADLPALVIRANDEHAACEAAIRSALQHAKACGVALLAAKKSVGHGGWEKWIGENCKFSVRMARNYMTIAKGWRQLANRQRVAEMDLEPMSLREALRLLSGGADTIRDSNFLERTCTACGSHLAVTSSLYATCPNCFDCRLWPIEGERFLTAVDSDSTCEPGVYLPLPKSYRMFRSAPALPNPTKSGFPQNYSVVTPVWRNTRKLLNRAQSWAPYLRAALAEVLSDAADTLLEQGEVKSLLTEGQR
jgi:hypothetical protein